jgi:hypothetical protein
VLAFLGRPQPVPLLPYRLLGEVALQRQVIPGQVVLGEEVEHQRCAGSLVDGALGLIPGNLDEVAASFPGNQIVEIPVLAPFLVFGDQDRDRRLDRLEQFHVFVHGHRWTSLCH